jgi:hypothetical protein
MEPRACVRVSSLTHRLLFERLLEMAEQATATRKYLQLCQSTLNDHEIDPTEWPEYATDKSLLDTMRRRTPHRHSGIIGL